MKPFVYLLISCLLNFVAHGQEPRPTNPTISPTPPVAPAATPVVPDATPPVEPPTPQVRTPDPVVVIPPVQPPATMVRRSPRVISETSTSTPKPIIRERKVYVPFSKLDELFSKDGGQGVFVPYMEFLQMWNRLNVPDPDKVPKPPVEGVVAGVRLSGRVSGDVAEIGAVFEFQALNEHWSRVPIGGKGLAITDVKTDAMLHALPDGYEVLFPKKGAYKLDATIFVPVRREAGRATLALRLPRTAVSQFELTIPEKGLEFSIDTGSAFTSTENADGSTKLLVYFGAAEEVTISWSKKVGETQLTPLLFAEARTEVTVGPGVVRSGIAVSYRVLRAGVDHFDLLVPQGFQVLTVDGENLKDWKLDGQKLSVQLHSPAKDSYELSVNLESPLGALPQKFKLPRLETVGTERQSGTITVVSEGETDVEVIELSGLVQQALEKGAEGTRPVGRFRYLRLPFDATFEVAEVKPLAEASSNTLLVVEPESMQLQSRLILAVKKGGIFGVNFVLPPPFERAEVSGKGVEGSTVVQSGEAKVVTVKFSERQSGRIELNLSSEVTRAKPIDGVQVPVIKLQGIERHDGRVVVAVHTSLKANTTDKGDLREDDVRLIEGVSPRNVGRTPLTLGFRFRGEAKPASLAFELRKPRVSASVETLLDVREALVKTTWIVMWQVDHAGVGEFALHVPKDIADEVQIEGGQIKERVRTEVKDAQGVATGMVEWKVFLQEKVLGEYAMVLTHEHSRKEAEPGRAAPLTLQVVRPQGVFHETGQIAVIKDGNLEFTNTTAVGLEAIDPKELNPRLMRDGIFLAFRHTAPAVQLGLEVSRNLFLEVPQAIVLHALLNTSISEDQAETTEVILQLRNKAQQFLAVELPSRGDIKARPLSDVYVNGQAQQPSQRPGGNELLIRMPSKRDNDQNVLVRLVYELPSPHAGQKLGSSGDFAISPPVLKGVRVLRSEWALYLPKAYRYVHLESAMREDQGALGWEDIRRISPSFGAPLEVDTETLNTPGEVRNAQGTEVQKEGAVIRLARLDAPSEVVLSYRSRTWCAVVEGAFFLLALGIGVALALMGANGAKRLAYLALVGAVPLIVGGALDPREAGAWLAMVLGAGAAVLVWIPIGLWRLVTPKKVFIPVVQPPPLASAPAPAPVQPVSAPAASVDPAPPAPSEDAAAKNDQPQKPE